MKFVVLDLCVFSLFMSFIISFQLDVEGGVSGPAFGPGHAASLHPK